MSVARSTSNFYESGARVQQSRSQLSSTPLASRNGRNETPLTSRRNSVVVTSDESDKMFDCFNSITRALKQHRMLLNNIEGSQKNLEEKMQALLEENKVLHEKIQDLVEQEQNDDGKIPPEISNDVHLLHNALEADNQYRPHERIISPHNSAVRRELEGQLLEQDKGFPIRFVKRGVVRYYETKRKTLQTLPENKEKAARQKADNKLRSRRKRLYKARAKVAEGADKERINSLSYDYVSDEENGTEENAGKWVVSPPLWRSESASALMQRLQQKVESQRQEDRPRIPRVLGTPSPRNKPRLLVSWAIDETNTGAHDVAPAVPPCSPDRASESSQRGSMSPISSDIASRSPSPVMRRQIGRNISRQLIERSESRSRSRSPPANSRSAQKKVLKISKGKKRQ